MSFPFSSGNGELPPISPETIDALQLSRPEDLLDVQELSFYLNLFLCSFFVFLLKGEDHQAIMRRRRSKKVGLTRMDAAIDALTQMGFSKALIKHKVNSLLEVYGGDEGWGFIEDAYYKLVIDTILEDQEKECAMKNADSKEDGKEVLDNAETSAASIVPEIAEGEEGNEVPDAAGAILEFPAAHLGDEPAEGVSNTAGTICSSLVDQSRLNRKGISCPDHDHQPQQQKTLNPAICDSVGDDFNSDKPGTDGKLGESEIQAIVLQLPDYTLQHERRKPCYGWISCESSDDEDDFVFLEKVSSFRTQMRKEQRRERKARWDVRL